MNDHRNEMDRLQALRANGVISQQEYDQEILRLTSTQTPLAKPTRLQSAAAIGFFVALGALAYGAVQLRSANDPAPQAESSESAAVTTNLAPEETTSAARPSQDYLDLGILIKAGIQPIGARVSSLEKLWLEQGREVAWEPKGSDWIMRTTWHDQLTDTSHEESFEFYRCGSSSPPSALLVMCPAGSVAILRTTHDGDPNGEMDPLFGKVAMRDAAALIGPAPTQAGATSSQAQPQDAASELKGGRCRLTVDGTSLISGACFYSLEPNGSFSIYETAGRSDGYFAMVQRDATGAVGFWNGSRGSSHAQDGLGDLKRQGACWSNTRAEICLWGS